MAITDVDAAVEGTDGTTCQVITFTIYHLTIYHFIDAADAIEADGIDVGKAETGVGRIVDQ